MSYGVPANPAVKRTCAKTRAGQLLLRYTSYVVTVILAAATVIGGRMGKLFCVLMLVASTSALAQEEVRRLQCDGKYSNFLTGNKDVVNKGGYVEVQKSSVRIVSVIGFEGNYSVHFTNESRVCFIDPKDKLIQGCLNRFSGELQLHQQSKNPRQGDFGAFDQFWDGKCSPARPLF